jgi:hypothetical protein
MSELRVVTMIDLEEIDYLSAAPGMGTRHSHRTLDRIDHRRKLKQHTVPRALHDAPPVLLHEGIGDLAVFAEGARGADFVETHEPRVACDVSGDYGSEPASDTNWVLLFHGD